MYHSYNLDHTSCGENGGAQEMWGVRIVALFREPGSEGHCSRDSRECSSSGPVIRPQTATDRARY